VKDMEFVKIGVRESEYGNDLIRGARLKVDIQTGDTVYKDAVITIPESTLHRIVCMYETKHEL
jgi:hypothetical protein